MYDHLAPYPTSGISALRILKRSGSMDGDAERNGSPCLSRWLGKHPSYRLPLHKPPPTPKILAWQRRPSRLRQVLDIWPLALDNNQKLIFLISACRKRVIASSSQMEGDDSSRSVRLNRTLQIGTDNPAYRNRSSSDQRMSASPQERTLTRLTAMPALCQ
jgi:hypothetical protein